MKNDVQGDFEKITNMSVPVKRAAYSDRTAWIMAILAELAYTPFDEESEQTILSLAPELAKLTEQDKIAERLTEFQKILAGINPIPGTEAQKNKRLKAALKVGGFELAGDVLHKPETDIQGFVAYRRDDKGTGMAVICFRGTKQTKDWMTDVDIRPVPITDSKTGAIIGNMHKGLHDVEIL